MRRFLFVSAILIAFLMSSCGSGVTVEMDNPTGETITVTIDGEQEYTLAPLELIEVKGLKKGMHTMRAGDGDEVEFSLEVSSLLNPTLSLYVIVEQEYGDGYVDDSKWWGSLIDGEEYWGPFYVFEAHPVIPTEKVDLGVLSPFEEEIKTNKSGTVVLRKIFRKVDFLDYYQEEYKEYIDTDQVFQ